MQISKVLLNKMVRVNSKGPESKIGRIIAIEPDYFTLLSDNEEVIYYRSTQIRSITFDTKDITEFDFKLENISIPLLRRASFQELFPDLLRRMIQVNRSGPDKIQGILSDVSKDSITLVRDHEMIHVNTRHIKSISLAGNQKDTANQSSKETADEASQEKETSSKDSMMHTSTEEGHPESFNHLVSIDKKKSQKYKKVNSRKKRKKVKKLKFKKKIKIKKWKRVKTKLNKLIKLIKSTKLRKKKNNTVLNVWLSSIVR